MSADFHLAVSRTMGVARGLQGTPLDESEVLSRVVVLTGERETLATRNGAWCLLNAMRLLSRIVGRLRVVLPDGLGSLENDVRELAGTLWSIGSVEVLVKPEGTSAAPAHAVLNVGAVVPGDSRWTTINSNGWLARVSSKPGRLNGDTTLSNPLGAMAAATLGVSEVFKRVYGINAEQAPPLESTEFSLYNLSADDRTQGPELPAAMHLPDTLVVGAGAIGNAMVLLILQLQLRGRVHIVDKQAFAVENLGTCVLLDNLAWMGTSKAQRLAQVLRDGGVNVSFEQSAIADAARGSALRTMATELVLNALDDVEARRDTQLLWPSVLVDGGINAVGAAVRVHRLDRPRWACMRCGFKQAASSAIAVQSAATGLSEATLAADHGRGLTDGDIAAARPELRPWLKEQQQLGRTVCATIAEAQARRVGMNLAAGFRPSAPFVAAMSATLVMTEALKSLYFKQAQTTQHFQLESMFIGPKSGAALRTSVDTRCECSVYRSQIEKVAADRGKLAQSAR